jgi:hypothetical protein
VALDDDIEVTPGAQDDEPQKTPQQVADYWLANIQSAEKRRKPFITRGKQIMRRYKNKRTLTTLGVPLANRRMNVLWSNVQTQKPVMFNQTPSANVSRRNKTKDPVGRTASIVLQNVLQNSLGMEDFDHVMGQVVEDRLLPGCGVAMVEYVPEVKDNEVGWQAAETRYVHWEDFITNPARVWQEVWFCGYRVYLTRKQCYDAALAASGDEAFAQDVWTNITLDHKEDKKAESGREDDIGPAKATVWVIWDMTEKQVIQISPGYVKAPLAVMPPPVNFDKFYPIPRPLQSTTANDSTLPVPDFDQYVDQADEIDMLTQRIGVLSKALRVRGLYPADMESLKQLVEGSDADMIPYDQFALLQERGGADGLVVWFPTEAIAKTLVNCIEVRKEAIAIMYEVTGISDVMRGATEAQETATAQQLKAQFGGIRIRESQKDVQRFIRDLLRLKAEVICEHFKLEVIQAMAGVKLLTQQQKQVIAQFQQIMGQFQQAMQQWQQVAAQAQQQGLQPPPQPMLPAIVQNAPKPTPEMLEAMKEPTWEEVMDLLRNEKLRGFVVDVETDSTIEPDQQAQQQAAVEFVGAVTQFVTAWAQVLPAMPQAAPLAGEMLAWATRQWKGADTFEQEIDEFVDQLTKLSQQPQGPNPEDKKAEAEVMKAQASVKVAEIGVVKEEMALKGDMIRHQQDMQNLAAQAAMPQAPQEVPNA